MTVDHQFGFNVMSIVRAMVATILATTLGIGIIIAELDESQASPVDPAVAEAAIEEAGPLNFDSTFLLLTAAIIILTVPDAIAYFRRKKTKEDD